MSDAEEDNTSIKPLEEFPKEAPTEEQIKARILYQRAVIEKYKKQQRRLRRKKKEQLDILNLGQGIQAIKNEQDEDEYNTTSFMDIFDEIFAEKLENYLKLERQKYELTQE